MCRQALRFVPEDTICVTSGAWDPAHPVHLVQGDAAITLSPRSGDREAQTCKDVGDGTHLAFVNERTRRWRGADLVYPGMWRPG